MFANSQTRAPRFLPCCTSAILIFRRICLSRRAVRLTTKQDYLLEASRKAQTRCVAFSVTVMSHNQMSPLHVAIAQLRGVGSNLHW
jgi:hypothetical protein